MSAIQIETTSDNAVLKFVTPNTLTDHRFEYHNLGEAGNSPLVRQLYRIPFVKNVVIAENYIEIEKFDIVDWSEVQQDMKKALEKYLKNGKPVFGEDGDTTVEVYAESTPNPNTQKFITSRFLTSQTIEVSGIKDATDIPLAFELFEYPFIQKVFISENYISITKDNTLEWHEVTQPIRDFLKEYLENTKSVISRDYSPVSKTTDKPLSSEESEKISKEIVGILEKYIKPAVAKDGGNIRFESYNDQTKTVNVTLQGACNGCPSAAVTLKHGVEATLKQFLPGKIESVNNLN